MTEQLSSPVSNRLSDTLGAASKFFRWWRCSLQALLPAQLAKTQSKIVGSAFLDDNDDVALIKDKTVVWQGDIKDLSDASSDWGGPVELVLPPSMVFIRHLNLPKLSGTNLRELASASSGSLPFEPEDVVKTYLFADDDETAPTVKTVEFVTKRENLQAVLMAFDRQKIDVKSVTVSEGAPGDTKINFFDDPSLRRSEWLGTPLWSLLIMAVLVGLGTLAGMNVRADRMISKLEREIQVAQPDAMTVRRAMNRQENLAGQSLALAEVRRQSASPLEVWLVLTEALNEDAYLTQIEMSDRQVRVTGIARNAAEVFESVQTQPLLEEVAFNAPTTLDQGTGMERFGLAFIAPSPNDGSERE